jgi:hypothetical protein
MAASGPAATVGWPRSTTTHAFACNANNPRIGICIEHFQARIGNGMHGKRRLLSRTGKHGCTVLANKHPVKGFPLFCPGHVENLAGTQVRESTLARSETAADHQARPAEACLTALLSLQQAAPDPLQHGLLHDR